MLRIAFVSCVMLLLGACAGGTDIVRPIPQDSPDYPANPAVLHMPLALVVENVDGLPQKNSLLNSDPYEIHLAPGKHLIEFVYYKAWGGENFGEVINSPMMAIEVNVEPGQNYFLNYDAPQNQHDAKKLSDGFEAWIDDPVTQVRYTAAKSGSYQSPLLRELAAALPGRQKSAVVTAVPATSTSNSAAEPAGGSDTNAISHLKSWWLKADKQQRQEFLNWVLVEKAQ